MESWKFIHLVDSDGRRRATISHMLSGIGIHVEPFEDSSEISWKSQKHGMVLAEDTPGAVAILLDQMAQSGNFMPIVAFSVEPTTHDVARAIREGAVDFLQWPCEASDIGNSLIGAQTNGAHLGSLRLREAMARSRIQRLTKREREVLDGVAQGLSNRKIGEWLAISARTVEIHRANMLQKMGALRSADAIRIAVEASMAN